MTGAALMDEQTLEAQLIEDVRTLGGESDDWSVGITDNITQRMKEHEVIPGTHPWLAEIADSVESARSVEYYFISLGCEFRPLRERDDGLWVYMYKKPVGTNP